MFFFKEHRVLVFPCSSGIGQEIYNSIYKRRDVKLYGLDSDDDTPGKVLFGKIFYSGAPRLSEDKQGLLEYVKQFCAVNKIQYIFPGSDDFINFLKENEDFLNAKVITSCIETCNISRSKKLTYEALDGTVRVPKMFTLEDVQEFPVFVKPERGAGALGCTKIENPEDLDSAYEKGRDIICEYLPGEEYTVDCLTGPHGKLLYHCPRKRTATRAGISIVTSGVTDANILKEVQEMAININNVIEFTGAWFFQVKHANDGSLCLLEIAPRVGGASCFSRMGGVNLSLLSLNIAIGLPVDIGEFNRPDCVMKVYKNYISPPLKFDNLYLDLDDTILLHGRVNPDAMKCIYKYSGKGVPIHLITRNPRNLRKLLDKHHIPETIFTSIQQIFDKSTKSKYILPNSVFVDDSFKERSQCSSVEKNIRCFDVDAFAFL
ncbi:unnamed protein product [Pylaiella littoralis]